jgi:hypothetical protein
MSFVEINFDLIRVEWDNSEGQPLVDAEYGLELALLVVQGIKFDVPLVFGTGFKESTRYLSDQTIKRNSERSKGLLLVLWTPLGRGFEQTVMEMNIKAAARIETIDTL